MPYSLRPLFSSIDSLHRTEMTPALVVTEPISPRPLTITVPVCNSKFSISVFGALVASCARDTEASEQHIAIKTTQNLRIGFLWFGKVGFTVTCFKLRRKRKVARANDFEIESFPFLWLSDE